MKKKLIHIAVWLVLGYFLFISFSMFFSWQQSLVRGGTSILLMAGSFYTAGWLVAEQLLIRRQKLILFVLAILLSVFLWSVFRVRIFGLIPGEVVSFPSRLSGRFPALQDNLLWGGSRLVNNRVVPSGGVWLISLLMNSVLSVIAVLLRLYDYKDQKEQESREELRRSQEAQILYLKSQVNPHFLFNTLNNLYGLTYSKSDLAPRMVLGLSDTMRYMIYETEQKLVPLEKELDFIRNYLELEKMRISFPDNVRISVNIKRMGVFIPPLLLLPFIENCFKHGSIGREEDGWLELDIWDEKANFYFVCKNSFKEPLHVEKKAGSGMGLSNVRKRLDLIFGEKYELTMMKKDDEFMVSLQFPVFPSR